MRYYTAKALGRVLGIGDGEITDMTLRGQIREGLAVNGLYTLEEAAREIIAAMKQPEERERNADYTSERARLMRVRRKSAEYDLGLREKELHRTDEIELLISKILTGFKAKIRSIPARLAPQCAKLSNKEEIFDLIKQVTDEALEELSDLDAVFHCGMEDDYDH